MPVAWRRIRLIGGAVLALGLIAFALLHLPPVRARVLAAAVSRLQTAGIVARVGRLDYNLLSRTIHVYDVALAAPADSSEPFFTTTEIHAAFGWGIFSGHIDVTSADVIHSRILIHRRADGRSNWPASRGSSPSRSEVRLPPLRARVADLAVSWIDDQAGSNVGAVLSADVTSDGSQTSARVAMSGPSSVRWRGRETALATLESDVSWNGRDLSVRPLLLRVSEGTARAEGRIAALLGEPRIDLQITSDVDLARISPWTGLSRPMDGRAHAEARVVGPLARPEATVAASGRDVAVPSLPSMNVDATVRVTTSTAELTSLRAQVAGGTVTADGQTTFDGPGRVRVAWVQLDPSAFLRSALARRLRIEPASRSSGSLEADWRDATLDRLQLVAKGRVAGQRTAVNDPAPTRVPVNGTFRLETHGRQWDFSATDVAAMGARATATLGGRLNDGDLARSSVRGVIDLVTVDLGELSRSLMRPAAKNAGLVRGTARGSFAVTGTLGTPSLEGAADATIEYGSAEPVTLNAHAQLSPEDVHLTGIDARTGASSGRGTAGWTFRTDAIAAQLTASVSAKDAATFSSVFPPEWPMSGAIDVSADVSGSMARPHVTATGIGTSLDIAGQHVDRLTAGATFDGARTSVLAIDRLVLEVASGRLDGHGTVDLTRQTYEAHLIAKDLPIRPVPGQTSGSEYSGRLNGSFDGQGAFSNLGGSGRITLSDARWGAADLGVIDADVALAGRDVTLAVNATALALTGDATVGIDSGARVAVQGRWKPDDLEAVVRRLGTPLSVSVGGAADLRFELNGVRDHLEDAHVNVKADRLDLAVADRPVRLARAGQLDYDGQIVRVDDIALSIGTSTLSIGGSLGGQGARGLSVALDGSLTDFAFLREFMSTAGSTLPLPTGAVQVRLQAIGALARPSIAGTFQVTAARIPFSDREALADVGLTARFDDGVLTVTNATAAFGGATVVASARVPSNVVFDRLPAFVQQHLTRADGAATLSARVQSITPAIAAPFVESGTLDDVSGQADASIQLEASRVALDSVRGTITLDRAEMLLAGLPFNQQGPTRLVVRDGRLSVDTWDWAGGNNRVVLRGSTTLSADPSLDLTATAAINLRVLNLLTPALSVSGRAEGEIHIGGTAHLPAMDGRVSVTGGEARLASPRMVVGDINGTVRLSGNTLALEGVSATVNGGDAEITGSITTRAWVPSDGQITLRATGASVDLSGLRAEADATITLTVAPRGPVVGGTVTLLRSTYQERLSLTSGLLRALRSATSGVVAAPRARSAIDDVGLDVRIVTQEDLLVDNNLARLAVASDLRLLGTVGQPVLTGRATIAEGGQVFFAGNRYRLPDQGSVDFTNVNQIEPDLDVRAVTRVQGNEITLSVKGTPATLQTTLTSDNAQLSQSDLVSLIVLGRTTSGTDDTQMGSAELIGFLSGGLLGTAGRAIGFDTVRVERGTPDLRYDAGLVATETDPTARLTVGKNIGSRTEVIFSQSLEESGGLTWILSFTPRSGFNTRLVSSDQTDRLIDFTHEVTFGSGRRQARPVAVAAQTVGGVTITGAGPDEAMLRSRLKLEPGDRFNFSQWQDDRDRIEKAYDERGHFEARIATRRVADPADQSRVQLTYAVRPGPRTTLEVRGASLPGSAIDRMERAWSRAVVDQFATEEVAGIARAELADEGFVQASVAATIERSEGEKRLRVTIEPGIQATHRNVQFAGNQHERTDRLRSLVSPPDLARAVWLEPDRVRDALTAFYRANGYLNASVRLDPIAVSGDTATRVVHVEEGDAFRVRSVRVDGPQIVPPDEVRRILALPEGEVFTEASIERANLALDRDYRARGFNSVRVVHQAEMAASGPYVDIAVRIDEGLRQRLRDVDITGLERTRPGLVDRALSLEVGEPVNLAAWSASRKRMYETSAFRSVDIQREVMTSPPGTPPVPAAPGEEPVRAIVAVQEWPFMRLRYGLDVYSELRSAGDAARDLTASAGSQEERVSGIGITADLAARNLFGRALSAGIAGRYTPDFRAGRVYGTTPLFFGHRITSNVFFERSHEELGTTPTGSPTFLTDDTTATFEQRVRPFTKTEVSYRYSLERSRTSSPESDPAASTAEPVTTTARLASTVAIDHRNDLFDSTRGWFHSSNVEYAPPAFGSDVRFVKYLLQQRYYHSVGRVVFATWLRVGLATVFGSELPPDDRFFAGGGNSVRGYAEDVLSPRDASGATVGGNALMVVNQEVRFPLFKWLRGVTFFDAGHAFEEVSNLSLRDLSASSGFGLRVVTPVVLLRVDLGVPFDAAAGPRRPRWFFSIGQTF